MLKGLYTAYTGMINEQHRMDVMTNNLANADTNGFKKEGATSQAFDSMLAYKIKDLSEAGNLPKLISTPKAIDTYELGNEANPDYAQNRVRKVGMNLGVKIGENYVDHSQGPLKVTGNTFDYALAGPGFFLIEYTNKVGVSSIKYTRDGNFTMDAQGYLRTQDGDYVLDQDRRRIRLDPNEKEIGTNTAGGIYQAGQYVATIGVIDFEDYDILERFGENFFQVVSSDEFKSAEAVYTRARANTVAIQNALDSARARGANTADLEGALRTAQQREAEAEQAMEAARAADDNAQRLLEQPTNTTIRAGYLETSNMSIVTEMVNMIAIQRQYESNQRVITTFDESLDIAVNRIGKIG